MTKLVVSVRNLRTRPNNACFILMGKLYQHFMPRRRYIWIGTVAVLESTLFLRIGQAGIWICAVHMEGSTHWYF